MRLRLRRLPHGRRGKVLFMTALLMPVLLGGMALSVDLGVIASTQGQLRAAADAGALGGAIKLNDPSRQSATVNMTPIISSAQSAATTVAQANKVLNQASVINANSGNASSGDIVVGYLDPNNTRNGTFTTSGSSALYNAVQMTLSRQSGHGGPVPTFFSGAIGSSGQSVSVKAIAIAQPYMISGATSVGGQNSHVLPIVMDSTTYNDMILTNSGGLPANPTTDQYSYNATTGQVSTGADGIYESVLYPVSAGLPGNWGTVKLGVSNNSTSTLAAQIQYGITPAEMANLPNGALQLDPSTGTLTLGGNPGISAGVKSAVDAIIGDAVTIPIYSSSQGNGSNTTYTVTGFGGIRVMASNFQGNPKYVVVQPAVVNDVTITTNGTPSTWTTGGVLRIFLAR